MMWTLLMVEDGHRFLWSQHKQTALNNETLSAGRKTPGHKNRENATWKQESEGNDQSGLWPCHDLSFYFFKVNLEISCCM